MKFIIALLALFLFGCASFPEVSSYKTITPPGKDKADHVLDMNMCGYGARGMSQPVYLACMEKRGYQIQATQDGKDYIVKYSDITWQ